MANPVGHLRTVGLVVDELRALGFEPVLVGGMALVVLGSRRVTRDFDFVMASPGDRLDQLVDLFYDRGLELASRMDDAGDVAATIASRRVAAIRLRIDKPTSVYFLDSETGLRIDLLFDFPEPAATLALRATRRTIAASSLLIASEEDLLRLKQIAQASRAAPGDAEDVAFLELRARKDLGAD
jgi:hypothetical protein